jgi:hypothetical protein
MRRDDLAKVAARITKEIESACRLALSRPASGADRVFEYGRACGHVQGLEKALALLNDILKEDEEREKNDGILRR